MRGAEGAEQMILLRGIQTLAIYLFQMALKTCKMVSKWPVADPENFGGGDLKHKTSKIRMSSPKLRVTSPKSKFKRFFRPCSGGLHKKKKKKKKKKKRSSPKLRLIFRRIRYV